MAEFTPFDGLSVTNLYRGVHCQITSKVSLQVIQLNFNILIALNPAFLLRLFRCRRNRSGEWRHVRRIELSSNIYTNMKPPRFYTPEFGTGSTFKSLGS